MAKSRRTKNAVNGDRGGEEEEEEVVVMETSEGEEEGGGGTTSPNDVDSGHETAEEGIQVR